MSMPMVDSTALRRFWVGDTAHLSLRVTGRAPRRPVDPAAVEVISFRRDEVDVDFGGSLAHEDEGHYRVAIDTANLDPGVYSLTLRVVGDDGVAHIKDYFVLDQL